MKPVTYHLSEQQIERLRGESKRTGLTVAELIRRAVDFAFPPPHEDIESLRYGDDVATVSPRVRKRGDQWIVTFRCFCRNKFGELDFEADSIELAGQMFAWLIDRQPSVHRNLSRAIDRVRKEIEER